MIKLYSHIGAICLTGLTLIAGTLFNQNNSLSLLDSNQLQQNLEWLPSYFTAQYYAQAQTVSTTSSTEIKESLPQLEAWHGTKWGMSIEQVNQLFEQNIIEKNYRRCSAAIRHLCSSYELHDYPIGNQSYNIEFTFIANQLTEIKFTSSKQNYNYTSIKSALDNFQVWLSNQYGLPDQTESQTTEYGSMMSQQWHLPEKDIQLHYETTDNIDINHLFINFTPNFEQFQIQTGSLN